MCSEYIGGKGTCLLHPSSAWHIVGLCQCVQSDESVTFIYSLWSLFYWAFRFRVGLCVLPSFVLKESPSLDWWCPNYRHVVRKCRNPATRQNPSLLLLFQPLALPLLWVLLAREVMFCSGSCTECVIVHTGKVHRWFTNQLFWPCLILLWEPATTIFCQQLHHPRRKALWWLWNTSLKEFTGSLGNIWFFLHFTDGKRPREGRDKTGQDMSQW